MPPNNIKTDKRPVLLAEIPRDTRTVVHRDKSSLLQSFEPRVLLLILLQLQKLEGVGDSMFFVQSAVFKRKIRMNAPRPSELFSRPFFRLDTAS